MNCNVFLNFWSTLNEIKRNKIILPEILKRGFGAFIFEIKFRLCLFCLAISADGRSSILSFSISYKNFYNKELTRVALFLSQCICSFIFRLSLGFVSICCKISNMSNRTLYLISLIMLASIRWHFGTRMHLFFLIIAIYLSSRCIFQKWLTQKLQSREFDEFYNVFFLFNKVGFKSWI